MPSRYYLPLILLFSICLLIPYLGIYYIQPTTDLWIQRAVHFYYAVKSFNFEGSYTMYHPGVTIMWLVGVTSGIFYKINGGVDIFSFDIFPQYIFLTTLSVVLAEIGALIVLYKVLSRILGERSAFLSVAVLLLEPFFLGNARSIHMDTLVTLFGFISLSYFYLGLKDFVKLDFVASGVFLGLGLLTRINTGAVFVFFVVYILYRTFRKKMQLVQGVKSLFLVGIVAFAVFYLLFPAMWFNPLDTLFNVLKEGVLDTALLEDSRRNVFLALSSFPFIQKVFTYPIYLLFRLTPVILLLSLYFVVVERKKLELESRKFVRFVGLFACFYYLIITIPDKQIFRYVLPIVPVFAVIAGLVLSRIKRVGLIVVIFAFQLFTIVKIYPNFFVYFNPLIGGISRAQDVINLNQDATGYKEVANYLNKISTPATTVAMYDSNAFTPIFKGNAIMLKSYQTIYGKDVDTDYVLLPINLGNEFLPSSKYHLSKTFKVSGYDYYFLYERI
ncbi:glycosyltransferase family 39 protein [Candidatus Parcubacteria bacterium]|nr:glycosyltransferase family 39 protein [Candidatus Parcubacteria bacterium]